MHGLELRGVERRDGGRGLQRAVELPLDGVAGDLHDHGAAGLGVEREHVDAGQRLGGEQLQRGEAQFLGEGLPRGAHEREQLLAVGRGLGDQASGLRGHQRLGRLVDAQHFFLQWDRARPLSADRRRFLNSGRHDAHGFARGHPPGRAHAGQQAEVLAVLGGEVRAAARATSPACRDRAWGSRSARTGRRRSAGRRPRARSPRPPRPSSAHGSASSSRWRLVRKRRASTSVPSSRESAASVAATVTSTVPGTSGMPPGSRSSRTGRPEVALERRAQVRVAPAPVAHAGGLGDDRVRRAGGVQPGVEVERVGRAPGQQAGRLAGGQRAPGALVLVQHGVAAVAADAARAEAERAQLLAGHRLHGPAPQPADGPGRHSGHGGKIAS